VHALDQALENVRREFDASCAQIARAARCQLTNELNQLLRRLRNYQNEGEWVSALLDGASRFAKQVAIFSLQNDVVHLRAQANLRLPEQLTFPLTSAAAFSSAVESRDPVIALRTASEVTDALAGSEATDRCHLLPIINGPRTAAVLFAADQEYMDVNGLELITSFASAVLERRANTSLHAQIAALATSEPEPKPEAEPEPPQPEPPEPELARAQEPEPPPPPLESPAPAKQALPPWADLSEKERALHLRAQRFSRVAVAEMQLAKPQGCRAGREQNNLYLFLKPEIDKARESYQKQFVTIPSMVDYLHLELVNTAAEGDERKLGPEYPGQLV
jgi:hypothetical protein